MYFVVFPSLPLSLDSWCISGWGLFLCIRLWCCLVFVFTVPPLSLCQVCVSQSSSLCSVSYCFILAAVSYQPITWSVYIVFVFISSLSCCRRFLLLSTVMLLLLFMLISNEWSFRLRLCCWHPSSFVYVIRSSYIKICYVVWWLFNSRPPARMV